MESSDTREPSYYEVALTNRQVLIAFVVILATLLGAFLSGVWIGRGDASTGVPSASIPGSPPAGAEEPVEQLTFFAGKQGESKTAAQAPPSAAADPATESMRKTLEAEMAANREPPATGAMPSPVAPAAGSGEKAASEVVAPAEPGSRTRRRPGREPEPESAPATAPEVAPEKPAARQAAAGSTWVQVYSSTNGERAREIAGQLRRAGFEVVVAELPRPGKSNWRVRAGPFATRDAAEAAATRLRREHGLDTWVTDSP